MRVTRSQLRKLIAETIFLEQADGLDPYNNKDDFTRVVHAVLDPTGDKQGIVPGKADYTISSISPNYLRSDFGINSVAKEEMLKKETDGNFVIGLPASAAAMDPFPGKQGEHYATILTKKNNQGFKFKSVNGFVVLD